MEDRERIEYLEDTIMKLLDQHREKEEIIKIQQEYIDTLINLIYNEDTEEKDMPY